MDAVTHVETVRAVQKAAGQFKSTKNISSTYVKYSAPQRFKIGNYASENGSKNAVRKFQNELPILKECTVKISKSI